MNLLNKVKNDMWEMKKAANPLAALLNTLYAEAAKVGKDAGNRESTDQEVIQTIKKFIKNSEEMLLTLKSLDTEIASTKKQEVEKEISVLKLYLPQQLDTEELKNIILSLETKNMGDIMKHLKDNYAGLYDGKAASEIAKSLQ